MRPWLGVIAFWLITALIAGLALAVWFARGLLAIADYQPQRGDVIVQSLPASPLVTAIEDLTASRYSHCGIVDRIDGRWVVHEALGHVRTTPLWRYLLRGRDEAFAVYRWQDQHQTAIPAILTEVRRMSGRPYDSRFRLDDDAIYCSELIYHATQRATGLRPGRLVRLGDLPWESHADTIRRLEGGPVPLDRLMITPVDLVSAPAFVASYRHRLPAPVSMPTPATAP